MKPILQLIVAAIIFVFSLRANSETFVSGNVSGNWTPTGNPYIVTGDITVTESSSLEIAPGVIVQFQGFNKMTVYGTLTAVGTFQDSILFIPEVNNYWKSIRFIEADDLSILSYCVIRHSQGSSTSQYNYGGGGGVFILDCSPTISHCTIIDNNTQLVVNHGGGGIWAENSSALILNNHLENNQSYFGGAFGGSLYSGIFRGNYVANNTANFGATAMGGGFYIGLETYCVVDSNIFTGNIATLGGAIGVIYDTELEISYNIFEGNHANKGGVLYANEANPIIYNNTMYNNSCGFLAAIGYHIEGSTPIYYNNIAWNSTPTNNIFYGNNISVQYSDIENGWAGLGNINSDPLFVDPINLDFNLQENSPCIDAGNPASPLDPDISIADMGALYFHQGAHPIISLSADSLIFPTTAVGNSAELILTINNIGEEDLIIHDIIVGEPEVFYTDWVSSDSIITPGDSIAVIVTFSPLQSMLYNDILLIENNNRPVSVYLEGQTPLPDISVSADSLIFPNTLMGSSSELPLTIFNNGDGDLILYNMTVGDPEVFSLSWNSDDSLVAPGDSLSIIVQFLPLVSTLYIDHLIIDNNDVPVDVYLKGLEENAGASVSLYPHVLNIQIPSGGGSFNFDVEIINPVDEVVVDFWSSATLPGGGEFPIYVRNNLTLQAGEIILREDLTQTVPASAPSGMYSYNAYLKDHFTWEILSEDFFSFEKVPGESSPNHNFGWELFGWDGEVAPSGQIPSKITLDASPNPFNPETTLRYNLPESGDVRIAAYDVLGREAAVLFEGFNSSGQHELNWNAVDLSSGIYFVHLTSNNNNSIKRVLLVK